MNINNHPESSTLPKALEQASDQELTAQLLESVYECCAKAAANDLLLACSIAERIPDLKQGRCDA